jgi:DNA-binding beta-propeller fold protein YncE
LTPLRDQPTLISTGGVIVLSQSLDDLGKRSMRHAVAGVSTFVVGLCAIAAPAAEPVSFVDQAAPILVEKCLVCHNARTAKGRFSLETYASLRKGGESGPALVPGDAEASNLWILIDSGDMPKDGDPLAPDQIALLKRWIAEGAKLPDEQLAGRPLASIIPKPKQPSPPEHYAAPVPVTALAMHPDGNSVAVSGYREVLVFDLNEGRLVRRLQNLAERIYGVAFSPDGERLAVAAGTPARLGEVKLFNKDGQLQADLATAGDSFLDVAFSPDGSLLAAAGADRTVRIWNTSELTEALRIEDHADWVTAVAFSPDGTRLATASRDKTAKVFDATTGESLATFTEHEQPVLDVLFAPDGSRIVSCGKDKRARIWNVSDAKEAKNQKLGGEATSLAAIGSEAFLCGSSHGKAKLFGFDGEPRKSFELGDWVLSVAASHDGGKFAVGSYDGSVTVFDASTGEKTRTLLAMPPKE